MPGHNNVRNAHHTTATSGVRWPAVERTGLALDEFDDDLEGLGASGERGQALQELGQRDRLGVAPGDQREQALVTARVRWCVCDHHQFPLCEMGTRRWWCYVLVRAELGCDESGGESFLGLAQRVHEGTHLLSDALQALLLVACKPPQQ